MVCVPCAFLPAAFASIGGTAFTKSRSIYVSVTIIVTLILAYYLFKSPCSKGKCLSNMEEENICPLCFIEMTPEEFANNDICTLECDHSFHKDCISKVFQYDINNGKRLKCPVCRRQLAGPPYCKNDPSEKLNI